MTDMATKPAVSPPLAPAPSPRARSRRRGRVLPFGLLAPAVAALAVALGYPLVR